MIFSGSEVGVSRFGSTMPVDFLKPGDLVFSPLADRMVPIKSIRTQEFDPQDNLADEDMPFLIEKGSLINKCPKYDCYFSKDQEVVYPIRLGGARRHSLEGVLAEKVGKKLPKNYWGGDVEIKYFKIIMDKPMLLEVNGVMIMSY